MKWNTLWMIFVLQCMMINAYAQNLHHAFYTINAENGLPNNSVTTIAKDQTGFMWFGTGGGLSRYDGKHIKTFLPDPLDSTSISSFGITSSLVDRRGNLWIGTMNGLSLYDPKSGSFKRYLYSSRPRTETIWKRIIGLFEDSNHNLWINVIDGLYVLKSASKSEPVKTDIRYNFKDRNEYYNCGGIAEDANGNLWAAMGNSMVLLSKNKSRFGAGEHTIKILPAQERITAVTSGGGMGIWLGTSTGKLLRFEPDKPDSVFIFKPFGTQESKIAGLAADKESNIWIATYSGLAFFNTKNYKSTHYRNNPDNETSLNDNFVLTVYAGDDGYTWVGTYNSGVNYLLPGIQRFNRITTTGKASGLSGNIITSIAEDNNGNILAATSGGKVDRIDPLTHRINQLKGTDAVNTYSILAEKNGDFLLSDSQGLRHFSAARQAWKTVVFSDGDKRRPFLSTVRNIVQDKQNRIWICLNTGLLHMNADRSEAILLKNLPFPNDGTTILEDSKGNIWVGHTQPYVTMLPYRRSEWVKIPEDRSSSSKQLSYASSFAEDSNGDIWLVRFPDKLLKYNKKKRRFEGFEPKRTVQSQNDANLFSNITSIAGDTSGNLWFGSLNHLVLLNPTTKKFTSFDKSDGIIPNEFTVGAALRTRKGMLYFGTNKGLIYFDPNSIKINENPPAIVLTDLEINETAVRPNDATGVLEQDISYTKSLTLKNEQNFFSIQFAVLNFYLPEKNRYAYKLKGVHDHWIEINEPKITFSNLSPGKYKLLISGANNDNVWAREPLETDITILAPVWQRWWAYLIYLTVVGAIVYIIVSLMWERASFRQTVALNRAKFDFFTNISHEIRTHIMLIMGPLDLSVASLDDQSEEKANLKRVSKNAGRLLELTTELLDFSGLDQKRTKLNKEKTEIVALIRRVIEVFEESPANRGNAVVFRTGDQEIFAFVDAYQFEKIIFNLMSNSFKFSDDGESIYVSIASQDDFIIVSVTDYGKGIAPQNIDKIFSNYYQEYEYGGSNTGYGIGLALSRRIIELHNGTIQVESDKDMDGGKPATTFTITFPKGSLEAIEIHDNPFRNFVGQSEIETEEMQSFSHTNAAVEHTILIAEDNAELRAFLAKSLQSRYHVTACENGRIALEKAMEILPDLIVTDLMMPELSGSAFCKMIKEDDRSSHIPVIILTAKGGEMSLLEGLESRADHYLVKPISVTELILRIENLLNFRNVLRSRFQNALQQREFETTAPSPRDEAFIKRVIDTVERNLSNSDFVVEELADQLGISKSVLYKKMKSITDMSVNDFIKTIRFGKAAELLSQGSYNVDEVSELVGFKDRRYFSKEFKKIYGVNPSQYQKGVFANGQAQDNQL